MCSFQLYGYEKLEPLYIQYEEKKIVNYYTKMQ